MGNSKKKSVAKPANTVSGMKRKTKQAKPKKYKTLSGSKKNGEASARFKMITERAQKIRKAHPKMKWKNCIKQASSELYR
ncbi:MAG: hypothetical protein C0596_16135 [Marinilabiliales bacterium]|nr:MAG: hypothetical protein C0596_16135 [Marinilabiliales bacterium]